MSLLVRISLVLALSLSGILGPLSSFEGSRAYANPGLLAGKPAAAALAAVLGASGLAVGNLDSDGVDQLYSDFSSWIASDEAQAAVKASQDAFLTNPQVKVVSSAIDFTATRGQSLLDQLDEWGNSGSVSLDALNTYTGDALDVLSDIPFVFDAFIRHLTVGSDAPSESVGLPDVVVDSNSYSVEDPSYPVDSYPYILGTCLYSLDKELTLIYSNQPPIGVDFDSEYIYLLFESNAQICSRNTAGRVAYSGASNRLRITYGTTNAYVAWLSFSSFTPVSARAFDPSYNPDVINPGLDVWEDSKDVIGGIADGSAFYGSDAVIDGDYIVNRGNMSIPWDWTDINSWADLLRQLGLGVAEGVYGDAIGLGDTAISVDAEGELVTDTVAELSANPGSTSPSRIRNWKNLGLKFKQIFPFCLYFDLVEMIVIFDAEPVAPKFDWVVPSIWEGSDYKITFDLSPWDSAASFLRMLLTVVFAIGFVFLLLRFVNPGRDNSDDGGSKG